MAKSCGDVKTSKSLASCAISCRSQSQRPERASTATTQSVHGSGPGGGALIGVGLPVGTKTTPRCKSTAGVPEMPPPLPGYRTGENDHAGAPVAASSAISRPVSVGRSAMTSVLNSTRPATTTGEANVSSFFAMEQTCRCQRTVPREASIAAARQLPLTAYATPPCSETEEITPRGLP